MELIARILRLPVVHFLCCLIAGSWIEARFPMAIGLPFLAGIVIGGCMLITALALAWAAMSEMRKHRTTVEPARRPTALVTSGIFARSRNPIYVALLLVLAAIAVMADSVWLLESTVLLWILLETVIRSEERTIEEAFAEPYLEYKRRVRRWL
jgi:protein-S-isoprenylcysteine O-methyltransferase Ste14